MACDALWLLLQVRNIGHNTILLSPDTRSERTIKQVSGQAGQSWLSCVLQAHVAPLLQPAGGGR